MPGPNPKPDAQRIRRNSPTFDWRMLPAEGRKVAAPALPAGRKWHPTTVAEWDYWWSTPQACAWDQSGFSLHRWALLMDRIHSEPEAPVALHAQVLAIEDRHGFSPAHMLKLRWRVADSPSATAPTPKKGAPRKKSAKAQTASLAGRLRVVS